MIGFGFGVGNIEGYSEGVGSIYRCRFDLGDTIVEMLSISHFNLKNRENSVCVVSKEQNV